MARLPPSDSSRTEDASAGRSEIVTKYSHGRNAGLRCAVGRLALLYLPAYRHPRREVTHRQLFESVKALLAAAADRFARSGREPHRTLSVIGSKPAIVA